MSARTKQRRPVTPRPRRDDDEAFYAERMEAQAEGWAEGYRKLPRGRD